MDTFKSFARFRVFFLVVFLLLAIACDQNKKDAEESSSEQTESSEKTSDETDTAKQADGKTADDGEGSSTKSAGSTGKGPSLEPGTKKQKKLLSKAKKSFLTDEFSAAEPIFEKVLETGPMTGTKMSAYIALAQIYIESGEAEKAIQLLERIPEPGKQVVEIRLMLARAYASREELREAVDEYRKVVELQPNYLFAYPPLGALYTEMGEKKKAAQLYLQYENRLTELSRILENPDQSKAVDRINVLDVFASSNDQRVIEAVLTALEDPNPRVRAKAAHTAAQLKAITAKKKLKEMMDNDADKYVRKAARAALFELKKVKRPPERKTIEKEDFQ